MQYVLVVMRLGLLLGLLYSPFVLALNTLVAPAIPALSIKSVHIATGIWPGFSEPNEQGAYFDLLKLLFPHDMQFQVSYTSFNRSVRMVEEQQADIVLGIGLNESPNLLRSDQPFDVDKIAVLFKPAKLTFEKPEDLKGYKLVTQRGYNYDLALGLSIASYEVDSIATGVNLVKTERVDAFLVEKTELEGTFSASQLEDMTLVFIAGEPIYIGFANNERGAQLKAWWDKQFKQQYHNGNLQRWYQQQQGMTLP